MNIRALVGVLLLVVAAPTLATDDHKKEEVKAILGEPRQFEHNIMCGTETPEPFRCDVLTYVSRDDKQMMVLVFETEKGRLHAVARISLRADGDADVKDETQIFHLLLHKKRGDLKEELERQKAARKSLDI